MVWVSFTALLRLCLTLLNRMFFSKKKEKTIRQRVEELIDEYQIPDVLQEKALVAIMELIERAKSPDMFCSKCDTRMSIDLESKILHCFSCGNKKSLIMSEAKTHPIASLKQKTEGKPNATPPDKRLLEAIDKAEGINEPRRSPLPTKKGKTIQELANSRGGGSKVTKEDDDFIKNNVPGAKNSQINWL